MAALKNQLAVCNARLGLAEGDAGATVAPAPEPPPSAGPMFTDLPGLLAAPPVEQVIVRQRDGTVASRNREDFPADTDEGTIIARTHPGRSGFFALDAGADDPPVSLGDLAGGDGTVLVGQTRVRFPKHARGDAGPGN
jgi:hypothetical protein